MGEIVEPLALRVLASLACLMVVGLMGCGANAATSRESHSMCAEQVDHARLPSLTGRAHWTGIRSVALSPNGLLTASCGFDGLRIWLTDQLPERAMHGIDSNCVSPRVPLPAETAGPINAVAFSPDGRTLAAGGNDGTILLIDAETWRLRHTLRLRNASISALAFSTDGAHLIVAEGNDVLDCVGAKPASLHFVDLVNGVSNKTLQGVCVARQRNDDVLGYIPRLAITAVGHLSGVGNAIVCTGVEWRGDVQTGVGFLWDVETNTVKELDSAASSEACAAGDFAVLLGDKLCVWNAALGKAVNSVPVQCEAISANMVCSGGNLVLIDQESHTILVYTIPSLELRRRLVVSNGFRWPVSCGAISSDGSRLVLGTRLGEVVRLSIE